MLILLVEDDPAQLEPLQVILGRNLIFSDFLNQSPDQLRGIQTASSDSGQGNRHARNRQRPNMQLR